MNDTPIYVNGRTIGSIRGETFYKTVSASKHFLRQPPAIAFDLSTLDAAERNGARFVRMKDKDSGKVYRASIHTIRHKGFFVNRGHGDQLALSLTHWSVNGAPLAEQLDLWGGGK